MIFINKGRNAPNKGAFFSLTDIIFINFKIYLDKYKIIVYTNYILKT